MKDRAGTTSNFLKCLSRPFLGWFLLLILVLLLAVAVAFAVVAVVAAVAAVAADICFCFYPKGRPPRGLRTHSEWRKIEFGPPHRMS